MAGGWHDVIRKTLGWHSSSSVIVTTESFIRMTSPLGNQPSMGSTSSLRPTMGTISAKQPSMGTTGVTRP